MGRRPTKYTQEFRDGALEMVRSSGKSLSQIARDLGVGDTTLGNWVAADRRRRGVQPPDQLNESERVELLRLRRENATLRMEREILKKVVMAPVGATRWDVNAAPALVA